MSGITRLDRWIAPLRRKVYGMIGTAIVQAVTDSKDLQLLKISLLGETHPDVERVQNFGFTSVPPAGSQAVVLFVGGRRDHPVVVACDDGRQRIKLEVGEAALYNDSGSVVKLGAGGKVAIGNDTAELLDLMDQLLDNLISAVVATAIGPQPLSTVANLTTIKTTLATLKGTL